VFSGGQKARISLARAVYSTAQTVLLDDILAALDVHTSVWIVTKCLKGDLLEGRTILLVVGHFLLA
jgi:ABC-type dipeptide/oligopeptide/nickel transport system ATPase subunit